jgi:hypothetical protein
MRRLLSLREEAALFLVRWGDLLISPIPFAVYLMPQSLAPYKLCLVLGLWLWGAALLPLYGQPMVATANDSAAQLVGFEPLRLDGPWRVAGQKLQHIVPFAQAADTVLSLSIVLPWSSAWPDTAYLYLEGVAWEAELLLGDYYLGNHQSPFLPWVVPIRREWVQQSGKRLRLRLRGGRSGAYEPSPFLGIFRPVWLYDADHLSDRLAAAPVPSVGIQGEKVGLLAPYYRQGDYAFDSLAALRMLMPLLEAGEDKVAFWFAPSQQMVALCEALGLSIIDSLAPGTRVAPVNWYPYEAVNSRSHVPFWLTRAGHRSPDYGQWHTWPLQEGDAPARSEQYLLFGLIFLPLAGAVLLKLVSPAFFSALGSMLSSPSMYLEGTYGGSYTSSSNPLLLSAIRILLFSAFLALGVYYIRLYNLWDWASPLTDRSLLYQVFGALGSLWEILGRSLLIGFGLEGLRYLLLSLIAGIFRLKGFTSYALGMDAVGNFPLLLLVSAPIALLLYWPEPSLWVAESLVLAVVLAYWLRRIYVNFIGLDRGAAFSLGMKILYVCGFDIAPVLIWL